MPRWTWLRAPKEPSVVAISTLQDGDHAWLEGVVDPLEVLVDPVSGEPAIAIEYRAEAPSALGQIYPGLMGSAAHTVHSLTQTNEFLLRGSDGAVRVTPEPDGDAGDVTTLHRRLLELHGVELRAEARLIRATDRVRIRVEVLEVHEQNIHRGVPWRATVQLKQLVPI